MNSIKTDLKHLNLDQKMINDVYNMYKLIVERSGKFYRTKNRKEILYACVNLLFIQQGVLQRQIVTSSLGIKTIKTYISEFRMVQETVYDYIADFSLKLNIDKTNIINNYDLLKDRISITNNKMIASYCVYEWLKKNKIKMTIKKLSAICNIPVYSYTAIRTFVPSPRL